LSGASGSDGTSRRQAVFVEVPPVASGDVASIVLMRTIVRLRRFVGADAGGQFRHRRFVSQFATQRFARRIELAPLSSDAARPRIAAQRVDHRAAHASFGEGFELDAARFVEPMRGIDQTQHAVLHQIADVD
jgi:hypothetical protein